MKRLILATTLFLTMAICAYAQQQVPIVSGAVTINTGSGVYSFRIILNQNVTSFTISGPPISSSGLLTVIFTQDATGGRTVTGYAGNIQNSSNITITSTANASTVAQFTYNPSSNVWLALASGGGSGGGCGSGFTTNNFLLATSSTACATSDVSEASETVTIPGPGSPTLHVGPASSTFNSNVQPFFGLLGQTEIGSTSIHPALLVMSQGSTTGTILGCVPQVGVSCDGLDATVNSVETGTLALTGAVALGTYAEMDGTGSSNLTGLLVKSNAIGFGGNAVPINYGEYIQDQAGSGAVANYQLFSQSSTAPFYISGPLTAKTFDSVTNCASSASTAVCGSAAAGHFVIAASATSVVVDTSAVTANSEILINEDQSIGTLFSPNVTCNTGISSLPVISDRSAGVSFTVTIGSALTVNPICYSYVITN